jgi:hypothetical protein
MSAALGALRDYVTAETGAQARGESTVLLSVTHSNLRSTFMELRFDLHVRARAHAPAAALQRGRRAAALRWRVCGGAHCAARGASGQGVCLGNGGSGACADALPALAARLQGCGAAPHACAHTRHASRGGSRACDSRTPHCRTAALAPHACKRKRR